tara:strand:- start:997 stop:2064 length:1068 start_codon:yes stop_codon:yes gene_type:complete
VNAQYKVAVVGGGIFGATAAIEIAKLGVKVTIFERECDLMHAASGINQYRLHRGYHYPRSFETMLASKKAEPEFAKRFSPAMVKDVTHYYSISSENSKVSADEYIKFCDAADLYYKQVSIPIVSSKVAITLEAQEHLFDPNVLRQLLTQELHDANVTLQLQTNATKSLLKNFDFVVIATYASSNELVKQLDLPMQAYQFEVCEKPIVRMPKSFGKVSLVIMDGPFMCIDPYGHSDLYVLGNVVHAIHSVNDGFDPQISPEVAPMLNHGIIKNPTTTKFPDFIESGKQFIPPLSEAEFIGSMFTVRTVLPKRDLTDERPTEVVQLSPNVVRLFSGKIGTSVHAAKNTAEIVSRQLA